jgi:hypothetical protein
MNSFALLTLLATWLISLSVAYPSGASSHPSLIPNGDFRSDTAERGWPDGWGSKPTENGKSWEQEGARHFIRLVSPQPGGLEMLYREVNLKPGDVKGINLTVLYRARSLNATKDSPGEARAILLFKNKAGSLLDPPPEPLLLSRNSADWNEIGKQVLVPATATRMVLMVGLFTSSVGMVDIAAVDCTPLDDVDSRKLIATAPRAAPGVQSWVSNGDFRKGRAAGDWPEDWAAPLPGMSWLQEDGRHFVRLVSQKPGESLMLSRTIPLVAGVRGIELLVRFRATRVEHGDHEWFDSRTIVHFLDAGGKQVVNEGRDLDTIFTHKPAPTGWIDRAHFLSVPEGATQLQLRSGLFQAKAGTVDLGEIRVTPLSDSDTDLLKTAGAAYISWKGDINAEMDGKAEAQIESQLRATGNLVPNGSFDLASKNPTWPDGWGGGPLPGLGWEQEDGKHFMRLTSNDPKRVVMLYKMVILKSGIKGVDLSLRYRLSGLVKGDPPPGDARMQLHFLDGTRVGHLENGKDLKPDLQDIIFSPTAANWTDVHRQFVLPPGATKLQLMPALWNVKAGTLDLADIRITPSAGPDTSAAIPVSVPETSEGPAPPAQAPRSDGSSQ